MSSEVKKAKLENLLKEMVTLALFEQMQTGQVQQPPAPASPTPPPPQNPPTNAPAASPEEQAPQNQPYPQEELTLDTMIERLNVIRGGKSFTDPEIYGQLTTYFKTLTPENKAMLDSFLQNVSKIMVNVRQEPDESGGQEMNAANSGAQNTPPPPQSGQPPTAINPQTMGGNSVAPVSPTGGMNPAGI